jgi:large subunit ribosomal protein L49
MKVMVKPRQLVLQGGYWKNDVLEWLIAKGF